MKDNSIHSEEPKSLIDVIASWRDILGQYLFQSFLKTIYFHPELKRIIFIGRPGHGKTTGLFGTNQLLPDLGYETYIRQFDTPRKLFLQGVGKQSLAQLTKTEKRTWDRYLLQYTLDLDDKLRPREDLLNGIGLIEMPAVGEQLPLGQFVLRYLANQAREQNRRRKKNLAPHIETLVISIIGTPDVIRKAKEARDLARLYDNDYDFKYALLNIGINRGAPTEEDKTKRNLISEYLASASSTQIESIERGYRMVRDLAIQKMQLLNPSALQLAEDTIRIQGTVPVGDSAYWREIMNDILYAEMCYHTYGFPQQIINEACFSAVNPYIGNLDWNSQSLRIPRG